MNTAMISAQLYDDDDKSTPLLSPSSSSTPDTTQPKLLNTVRKYELYSAAVGGFFGLFIYLGSAFIIGALPNQGPMDAAYRNSYVPILLFSVLWIFSLLVTTALLLSTMKTLATSHHNVATQVDGDKWHSAWLSMVVIFVCCFILGFENGAVIAWGGFLAWNRPVAYNGMFLVYFALVCLLTTWALRLETHKLEVLVENSENIDQDATTEAPTHDASLLEV